MPPLEPVAVVFGLANIGLLVRRSIWNFPFAIAMVSLYAVIFFEQRLYAEAGRRQDWLEASTDMTSQLLRKTKEATASGSRQPLSRTRRNRDRR